MSVALFVPCYVDQLYPDVAVATLELLERLGSDIDFPRGQTCCGQPMANTGCSSDTKPVAHRFVELFADYDTIVCPSASCVSMVRNHYADYFAPDDETFLKVSQNTFELSEYLHDVVQLDNVDVKFPHTVSLHQSCHGLRELRLGPSSEAMVDRENKVRNLLDLVGDIRFAETTRVDECCGFGGTFSVNEADVSVAMGRDRVADHVTAESEVIVSADMSCLMHMQGLIRRAKTPIHVMHVAQILVGRPIAINQPSGN